MSIAKIQKSIFNGEVTVPASKSVAHRALICSFLAGGGNVEPIISSKDMAATVGIINSLKKGENTLNSIESGSTLRFMIPVAAALGKEVTFVGQGSLLSRPIGEYLTLLPLHGTQIKSNGYLPATISGKLRNGSFEVNGNVSSQYITGLLLALAAFLGGHLPPLSRLPDLAEGRWRSKGHRNHLRDSQACAQETSLISEKLLPVSEVNRPGTAGGHLV